MSEGFWTGLGIFLVAVIAAALLAAAQERRRKRVALRTVSPVAAAAAETPPPADEALPALLLRLGAALEPLAEKSGHPNELTGWPEFHAVVAAFQRPDASLDLLRQYAVGANWPLACAAFTALAQHPERNRPGPDPLAPLANLRPWTIRFALDYALSLEPRPPVGAPLLRAPYWWADNLVIPGLFRDYFEARAGDAPTFGPGLDGLDAEAPEHIAGLLKKIGHPTADVLLDELQRWRAARVNRVFLTGFGRFWVADDAALLADPAAWHEPLVQAQRALRQTPPRSVVVSGEPRIGKTAFLRLLAGDLADAGWSVFEASAAEVMADQIYIGQLEGRVRQLVAELDVAKRVAWYVTDLVQLAGSGAYRGQTATILDQIIPAISAGRLVILAEASPAALARLFQSRPSLRSLFEVCRLHPMSEAEATALGQAVAGTIERGLRLQVGADTVPTALQLAQQYLGSGELPGILIELLKRAAQRALSLGETSLSADSVLATLSQLTGLPRAVLDDKERIDLGAVRQFFAERVIGQTEAVGAVVDRIAMLKAGLTDPDRPIGVFLFAGPTGTGKTELAKTLAEFLFGSPDRMARLDMSEFQNPESLSKIVGQRDGAAGDSLVERVRKQPFSVVLLDEFEKAHPNVWDLFLQIFDDGRLTDAGGNTVDFRHAFIILTSNLGATLHRGSGLGFLPDAGAYEEDQVLRTVAQTFRPEFVNRLDRIIVFRPLSRDLMRDILRKELKDVLERRGLRRRDWAVEWEASAIEFLLDRGFSPEMGARPLKRAIDQYLLAPLAATLVEHRFPVGDQFLFVRSNGKALEVEFVDPDAEVAVAGDPEPAPDGEVSLAAMIVRPAGNADERAALAAASSDIRATLEGADWAALRDGLQAEAGDPGFWSRADRHAVLARIALIDRVAQAARTADGLRARLDARAGAMAPRELVARLALQLHLVQRGIDDARLDAPIDVLLAVEPALDGAADAAALAGWCERLRAMYCGWAARRHMQIDVHAPARGRGAAILQIAGFGAFRTLDAEAGLHVLDSDGGVRMVARVKTAAGPWEEPRGDAYRALAECLAQAADSTTVVRRYRESPAPLVRDARAGWRSGRLDAVLGGDFDLIGALR